MENADSSVDRISDLPDSVLTHILSFSNTKEAVNTCILSKRWTNIWAFVPVLYFQSDQFRQPNISLGDQDHTKFVQFVYGVFDHRETVPLKKFSLSFEGVKSSDLPHIIGILDRAAMCMPRVMSINVSTVEFIELPLSIFTCASIDKISLSFDAPDTFVAPKLMNLSSLKNLELTCLCVDDNFVSTILMGCPNLEELVMSCCILDVYEICSNKLKKLVLDMCVQMWDVHISCPAVVSLRIKYLRKGGIRLHNVSPLARADICFQDAVLDDSIGKYVKVLRDLSNVASLRLHTTCRALQVHIFYVFSSLYAKLDDVIIFLLLNKLL